MKQIDKIKDLKFALSRFENKTVGFVPTMGALHDGHLSLIRKAKNISEIVVVSIFVNPTQFNDPKDFKKYPKVLDKDLVLLEKENIDFVFVPSENEIYPTKDNRKFDFGMLERVMEGEHRQGHFNGVAQIVSKLFDIINPDIAVFGEKDFQQLAIIKKMTKQLGLKIKIVGSEIIRENDGLAMSSRNLRLSKVEREHAALISQVLRTSQTKTDYIDVEELTKWVIDTVNADEFLNVEYFQIVNQETLQPVSSWQDNCDKIGCIAVFCGEIRLIDNIKY